MVGFDWVRVGVASLVFSLCAWCVAAPSAGDVRGSAELRQRRLIGKAWYENDKFKEAAAEFRRCIELAPGEAADLFNLGLTLLRAKDYDGALGTLDIAESLDPELLAVHYLRGIIRKRQIQTEEAVAHLERVLAGDPTCRGAYYNVGICYKRLERYDDAIRVFRRAAELHATDPSTQYQLLTLYRRTGDVERFERHKELYDRVKHTVADWEKTPEALERSKYTHVIVPPRMAGASGPQRDVRLRFVNVTKASGMFESRRGTDDPPRREAVNPPGAGDTAERFRDYHVPRFGGAVVLADCDGDGDLDLYGVNCGTVPNRLYRNNGHGSFEEVSESTGVADTGFGKDAVFGDYDNDGHLDLYVVNHGANVLYHNRGDGTFEDVSTSSRVDEPQYGRVGIFLDYDHDNDLDLFVGNDRDFSVREDDTDGEGAGIRFAGQSDTLLRNNGHGVFSDETDEAGILVAFDPTQDAAFADFDGDLDTDLFVVNEGAPSRLFLNARFGRFELGGDFPEEIPIDARATAAGDVDRDGDIDLIVATGGGELLLYSNDGNARFHGRRLGSSTGRRIDGIVVTDLNYDGWSDLLVYGTSTFDLLIASSGNTFRDMTEAVGLAAFQRFDVADVAVGDLDADGDLDLVLQTREYGLVHLENQALSRNHWLALSLVGKKSNRNGYGATVEVATGGHYQKLTFRRSPAHFGLGELGAVDVVRVTWPNGVVQNIIQPKIDRSLAIQEVVRVSASCGFLYAFNGGRFELINEILGVGPLGVPMAPGVFHQPDSTELTLIEGDQLHEVDGAFELRLTEELREIMFADKVTLRVIDHPAGLEIVPNEMFTAPPFPEDRFFAVRERRPVLRAVDDRGHDVKELISRRDGRFPTFEMTPYEGLASAHSLVLDLGDLSGAARILLFLDGWIHWADSSVVMAVAQDPRFAFSPLRLDVRGTQGDWVTVIASVGLPTSKGIVVPVELTGMFPTDDFQVRLSTSLCVYFDRVFVATDDVRVACKVTELPVASADLHYRGFSSMRRDELGFERFTYETLTPLGAWSPPEGLFTRYGDVELLLSEADNRFVIFGPGDELTLRFDARGLGGLASGWRRDFIFYANGWVKDGDLNTKHSGTVRPLPFHGMSGYPYGSSERYPDTAELRDYQRRFNTRPARATVGSLGPELHGRR